jgi:hypothetical protein
LALRIDALLRHLRSQGVTRSAYAGLSALRTRLKRVDDPGKKLWDSVLRRLEAFAAGSPEKRRQFWKRG